MSEKHHSFFDGIKSLVIDETPEPAPIHAPAAQAPQTIPASAPFSFSFSPPSTPVVEATTAGVPSLSSFVNSTPVSSPEAEDFYHKLVTKTDFEQTSIAAAIHKFLDPLAALPLDSTMKFKTAIAQAKAQGTLTEDAILGVFDDLKAALAQAQDSFTGKAAAFETKEVTARQDRIAAIQAQITSLQAEQAQLASDLSEAQAKAARTHSGFNSAIQRRSVEIDQQKAQYATMLK